ncbi:MAG: hypothetical protein KAQ68_10275 [Clostridiales bacterium]|nr:hypothetical protein [Clostridiales bacterium]
MRKLAIFPYISLFKMKLINTLAYRASSWSMILGGAFYGVIQTSIMLAFFTYGNTSAIMMTQTQAVSHMWMVVILYGIMPFGGNIRLYDKIASGLVAYDLCRPLDLYWNWYTTSISTSLTNLLIRSSPILLLALLLPSPYTLGLPVSFAAFLIFVVSLILAIILASTISMLISLAYVNADMGLGVSQFIYSLIVLFSGDLFPLSILPNAFASIIRLLPFAGLKDIPVSIYLGLIPISKALYYMAIQLFWTIILVVLGRFLLRRFTKKIIIQGG